MHFDQISVEQGLSSNLVTDILQDSRGFIWFGTGHGLNRFDGYGFTIYKPVPGVSNSLSSSHVNVLFEDSFGTIWANVIGNIDRVDRIDGSVTRMFHGMWHTSICEDTSRGRGDAAIWFTSNGNGLQRWDRSTDSITYYRHDSKNNNSLGSDSLLCSLVDEAGTLWIGSLRGLNSLDKDRRSVMRYPAGPTDNVHVLWNDTSSSGNILWIGTRGGLYRYDKHNRAFQRYWNPFAGITSPDDNDVRTLYCDRKGILWVGMAGGIASFDRESCKFTTYQSDVGTYSWAYINKSWQLFEDPKGILWSLAHSGISTNPLRRFDRLSNRWVNVQTVSGSLIAGNSLWVDFQGTIWLGTADRGVLQIDANRKAFRNYLSEPDPQTKTAPPVVSGIAEDPSGNIWLGSDQGLFRFDPSSSSLTQFVHDPRNRASISSNRIGPVIADHMGGVWIGTEGSGVDHFEVRKNLFIHHQPDPEVSSSLSDDLVTALLETRDRTIWAGPARGMLEEYLPASRTFRHHFPPYPDYLNPVLMYGLVEDPNGLLWFILRGGGLLSYNRTSGVFQRYSSPPEPYAPPITLATAALSSLYADRKGILWVGADVGLIRFDQRSGKCTVISERDGLENQFIRGILEDDKGNIWLGTAKGISKYDPRSGKVWNYNVNDGLRFGQCVKTTGCKARNGEMYFGGNNGFVRFHPDSIGINPYVPPIVITAFNTFGKAMDLDTVVSEKKSIELSYVDNVISFEFAALNYSNTQRNLYAYKLEGFDRDWVYCGARRSATYTNLDGGRYVFRVKGSNNDGVWNEEGTSVAVIIIPPFWQTWWFRALSFVAILISSGGTIRYVEKKKLMKRIKQLEQERTLERERARISQDIHDEVGSSLSEIAILSELAKKNITNPNEAEGHVREISDRAAEVIDSVSEIVWAMNPKNDTLDNLVAHIRRYAVKYLNLAHIECRFSGPEDVPAHRLTAEVRRNLFLVIKEALHNIVKHSGTPEACFKVTLVDGKMEIRIEDRGKGFILAEQMDSGNGLGNMSRRMDEIGGACNVESQPGHGTSLTLSVTLLPRTEENT